MKQLGLKNPMDVPRITKVTLNMGVGEALADKKILENAMSDLTKISGQKPVQCNARKSVASFKMRDGVPIGCKVTLRNERMYEFLDRLISVAIPRIRDFRGFSARVVRRPRQLQPGRERADHLPGNQLRPSGRDPRSRHHDHDDCKNQRGRSSVARGIQVSATHVSLGAI